MKNRMKMTGKQKGAFWFFVESPLIANMHYRYEKTRDGPSDAALDKLLKDEKDLIFSNKNLELSSNSYDYYKLSWAKGNVRVNGGKWYFEVRLAYSGTMQIGWCTESYDPRVSV